jgi:hypothetical protein
MFMILTFGGENEADSRNKYSRVTVMKKCRVVLVANF